MEHNKTNNQHWRNGLNKLTFQFSSSKDGGKQKLGEVLTRTLAGYCVAEPSAESGGLSGTAAFLRLSLIWFI